MSSSTVSEKANEHIWKKIQNNDFGPKKCPIYLNMAII